MMNGMSTAWQRPTPNATPTKRADSIDADDLHSAVASPQGANPSAALASTNNGTASFGLWVAVRVRPFNKRELDLNRPPDEMDDVPPPQPCVELERDRRTMVLLDPTKGFSERATFSFDFCFSAFRPSIVLEGETEATSDDDEDEVVAERAQAEIYTALGEPILTSAWQGFNGCIFAYGQTSSGKTYTMMGTKRDPGVIPRLCRQLFQMIEEETAKQTAETRKLTRCSVSYMEIYNEQVKDLLKPRLPNNHRNQFKSRFDNRPVDDSEFQNLKVRQHPLHGPFVEGLVKMDVSSWIDCVRIIRTGNEVRSSCTTEMNDLSSRSHAIFQIVLTQTEALGAKVRGKEVTNHKVSKINLVDLAGSERITRTNVTGKHITEANYINQSLSTLRRVIDVLVTKKKHVNDPARAQAIVVPYRESLLTWILSDNFGGNSKTAMIANVSPHHSNFLETESTLRYATLAKGIINRVRVNEDPSTKLIRELQSQLKALQAEMSKGPQQDRVRELEEEMEENKTAMEELQAREESMRLMIQESKLREQQLMSEREQLKLDQEHWRNEAERLVREKEELRIQLSKLGHFVPETKLPMSRNMSTGGFWMTEDGANPRSPLDEGSQCPPQMRRKDSVFAGSTSMSRTNSKRGLVKQTSSSRLPTVPQPALAPAPVAPTTTTNSPPKRLLNQSIAPSPITTTPPQQALPLSLTPTTSESNTVSPVPKYGRRAMTEEGRDREATPESARGGPNTAGAGDAPRAGRRRHGAEATSGGPVQPTSSVGSAPVAAVPASLAHLTGGTAPKPQQRDALDSFLTGGGVLVPPKRSLVKR